MSRAGSSDAIEVRPTNNIYTVLVVVATLASALSMLVVYMRSTSVFEGGLFGSGAK